MSFSGDALELVGRLRAELVELDRDLAFEEWAAVGEAREAAFQARAHLQYAQRILDDLAALLDEFDNVSRA